MNRHWRLERGGADDFPAVQKHSDAEGSQRRLLAALRVDPQPPGRRLELQPERELNYPRAIQCGYYCWRSEDVNLARIS